MSMPLRLRSVAEETVVATLREAGPSSRADLTHLTGLGSATVNRAVAHLIDAQVVVAAGHRSSTGGRPAELVKYNGGGLAVAGVSVTEESAVGLLVSLDGEIVGRDIVAFGRFDSPEGRLTGTLALLDRLMDRSDVRPRSLGVAVPGVVNADGVVSAIPELGWDRLALADMLAARVGIPVVLDNDANCLAAGEHSRGVGQGVDALVALVVRNGLGAGIIANGQIYRGRHHAAGEIGYMLTGRESLSRLFPDRGDLEQRVGSQRLEAHASALGLPAPDRTSLPQLVARGMNSDGAARAVAAELLDLTALALSALCVVLDPELVILGGPTDDTELTRLAELINQRLLGRILRVPRIEAPALGTDAIPVGAAQLASTALTQ
jgi:predicted NBD/HSP70 family sugar kinase